MNNLSVSSLKKMMQYILLLREMYSSTYQRVWFDIPLLRQPAWQQITLLPESYQEIHQEYIEMMQKLSSEEEGYGAFRDFEIQKMQRNLAYWKKNADASTQQKNNFYAFFNEHDRRRATRFENTFPEMSEFWTECKNGKN